MAAAASCGDMRARACCSERLGLETAAAPDRTFGPILAGAANVAVALGDRLGICDGG